MTDIRELLRQATDDLVVDHPDPVDRVRRAATRRRRTWAATVAVVAAVTAAVVIPLSLETDPTPRVAAGPSPTASASSGPVIETWESDDAEAAAGFGSIWGLQCCGGTTAPSSVDRLDPTTGERLTHIPVPGPTAQISTGVGRVWTLGATDGGPSAISVIDPATSRVTTLQMGARNEPDNIAFSAGSAWVTIEPGDQIWRLTPTAAGVAKTVIAISGAPMDIAATGRGALWVSRAVGGHQRLSHLIPTPGGARIGETVDWPGNVFGRFNRTGLLASAGPGQLEVIDPSQFSECLACAQSDSMIARGQVFAAARTPRGVFAATTRGVFFYSAYNLSHFANGAPNASIHQEWSSIAADGNGVVIGAADRGLVHWIPADTGHSPGHDPG